MSFLSSIQGISHELFGADTTRPPQELQNFREAAQAWKADRPQALGEVARTGAPSFSDVMSGLVEGVQEKHTIAREETRKILSGESTNLHQSVIAGQEASVAFTLMVEVRNKLVEAYQELMRMQV